MALVVVVRAESSKRWWEEGKLVRAFPLSVFRRL